MTWRDHTYEVAFIGHRDFCSYRALDERFYSLIKELIRTKPFVEFYIGRNGEFDIYAATVVKRVQKAMGTENNELVCVLPYSVKDIGYYEDYYDRVMIPECVGRIHPKAAITKRNQWMVEQADLLICYVRREKGGAYTALKYAQKLQKPIINLAEKECEKAE